MPELGKALSKLNNVDPPKDKRPLGEISFNYKSYDGRFVIGEAPWAFETKWSSAGTNSAHLYNDPAGIEGVAIAEGITTISQVTPDVATEADFTSRSRTPKVGQVAILRNTRGFHAALQPLEIGYSDSPSENTMRLRFAIQTDRSADFSSLASKLEDLQTGIDQRIAEDTEREAREQRAAEETAKDKSDAISVMTEWFDSQFEPPENQTPRAEGEYLYTWGGPFEASDVLHDTFFEEYSEEWIEEAVDEIEMSGTYEWAPSSIGDYYDHPAPDENELSTIATHQRDEIVKRITNLKGQLEELPIGQDNIGHNHPPESIGAPPYDDEDRDAIQKLLGQTQEEISEEQPDQVKLRTFAAQLKGYAKKAMNYAASKADLAINEAIKKGVPIGIAYLAFGDNLQKLLATLLNALGG
jgi:hypothetical protein